MGSVVAHQICATLRYSLSPGFGILMKQFMSCGVDFVLDKAGNSHLLNFRDRENDISSLNVDNDSTIIEV